MTTIARGETFLWGDSDPTRTVQGALGSFNILNGAPQIRFQARLILTFVNNFTVGSGQQVRNETIWTTGFFLIQPFPFADAGSGNRLRIYLIPNVDIQLSGVQAWLYQ